MSISAEDLKSILQQQQAQFEALLKQLSLQPPSQSGSKQSTPAEVIAATITEFIYDPDSGITFESWFNRWEDVFRIEFANEEDDWKVRLLIRKLGVKEHERYKNTILPKCPRDFTFDETVKQLSETFGEKMSLFNIRYQCLKLVKNDADDYQTYSSIVNRECERFKLRAMTEDQFKCLMFVCGLQSPRDAEIRTRLLNTIEQDPNASLRTLTAECQRILNLKHDSKLVQDAERSMRTVNTVSFSRSPEASRLRHSSAESKKKPPTPCRFCGSWHFHKFCPFRQHRCQQCRSVGHKEGFCPKSPSQRPNSWSKSKPHQSRSFNTHANSLLATFKVDAAAHRRFVSVRINDHSVRLQIDTASDITIISRQLWKSLGRPTIHPTKQSATSACGGSLKLLGRVSCSVAFNDNTIHTECYISSTNLNLIGIDWLEQLGLLDVPINTICSLVSTTAENTNISNHLVSQFADVFQETLGLCSCAQATLHLLPNTTPAFRPKRPVPYAALPLVDQELQRLEKSGVLVPVTFSKWAAPIVVVKKSNGTIRICADFSTGLNASLQSDCYPLPTPEDIFTVLSGGKYFAKIDLAEAYFQVEVTPESRELLTINTHRGLYQYTRLPFGVKTAPAIFQKIMDNMITGLPGTAAYLDDIVIVGQTKEQLKERLEELMKRIKSYGFKLRQTKCQFFLQSIKYLGFHFDAAGRRPDPENVRAILDMPEPKDVKSLRSFLGLVTYYSVFLPSLHEVRAPLNNLLRKDVPWDWSQTCRKAFIELKRMLASKPLVTHFNPSLPIIVAADASQFGVGAVISHNFPDGSAKAIAHASRTLTSAEKNYSQIEKEALAIIFAVKKFHKFLYGRQFTLLTDHKPLLSIFGSKKGIPAHSASRLQRWATILLGYDFDIQYCRTSDFSQADGLSRLIDHHQKNEDDTVIAAVQIEADIRRQLSDSIRGIPITAADIRRETSRDHTLQLVAKYIKSSWPMKNINTDIVHFFRRRHSLSVVDGCIMCSDRVVVPPPLRRQVLRQFHSGHPGMSRMKALARGYVYWPGIDSEIEQTVKLCSRCQEASKLPPKQPPTPWPTPEKPWSRIHVDFAGPINGQYYLVAVDALSKWPEIIPMRVANSSTTISALQRIFALHGLPVEIVSDNGSQFTSAQFRTFCDRLHVKQIHSPPYHPQSNGQAERFVDTFKRALQKSHGEGTNDEILNEFLFVYRTTPNPSAPGGLSPAEVLMGRKLRTVHTAMIPTTKYTNKAQTSNGVFEGNSSVYARDYRTEHSKWAPGTVIKRCGSRLFEVEVEGEKWIRHQNQLRSRTPSNSIQHHIPIVLPLDLILDTFSLPQTKQTVPPDPGLRARRWTDRVRRSVRPFQVDPKAKRYK